MINIPIRILCIIKINNYTKIFELDYKILSPSESEDTQCDSKLMRNDNCTISYI